MAEDSVTERVRLSREAKLAVLLLAAGIIIWLLMHLRQVLGPFLWGAIIAYVFSPAVDWLEARTRLRRTWVIALLYLVGLAVAAWAATAFVPLVIAQARAFLDELPHILTNLGEGIASLNERFLNRELELYGLKLDPTMLANEAVRSLQNLVGYLTRQALPAVFSLLEGLGRIVVCLIVSFYLLRSWKRLGSRIFRLIPRPYRGEAVTLLRSIDRVIGAYIRGQLLLIAIMAAANFVALSILRVRYALIIALISGVLEVVPLFGPFMAGAIAVSVALFQPVTPFGWSNLTLALAVVVSYTVLRQIEDQIIVPNLLGQIVDLHPLLVLFALIAGGTLAGFTGLVICVPTAAALKIIVTYLYGKIWDEEEPDTPQQAPAQALADVWHQEKQGDHPTSIPRGS